MESQLGRRLTLQLVCWGIGVRLLQRTDLKGRSCQSSLWRLPGTNSQSLATHSQHWRQLEQQGAMLQAVDVPMHQAVDVAVSSAVAVAMRPAWSG